MLNSDDSHQQYFFHQLRVVEQNWCLWTLSTKLARISKINFSYFIKPFVLFGNLRNYPSNGKKENFQIIFVCGSMERNILSMNFIWFTRVVSLSQTEFLNLKSNFIYSVQPKLFLSLFSWDILALYTYDCTVVGIRKEKYSCVTRTC